MLDEKLISILEYLEPYGLGNSQNIKDLINTLFPVPKNVSERDFNSVRGHLSSFLSAINKIDPPSFHPKDGLIQFDNALLNTLKQFRDNPDTWFGAFKASITNTGIKELTNQKEFNEQSLVNKSIIETNQSVKETNHSIIDISIKQADTNEKIADNSKAQTDILKSQRLILWTSVFVAVCSAFISYLSYRKDVPSNQLRQELKTTNQRLDSIRKELSQIKSSLSPAIEAKKALPKKN